MPAEPQHVPDARVPKLRTGYLWVGLVLLLVIIAIDFVPYNIPGILGEAGNDARHFLTLQLFSLGQVSISILSLLKAALFLLVLSAIACRVRHPVYMSLRRTAIGEERAYCWRALPR